MATATEVKTKITPNKKQQEAIDTLKGSVMLLAGPGTGKTFTVINRIEKMLTSGVNPTSILCLTFSDAAANEMRKRLIKKTGVIASQVDIYTYHSFCNEIIKEYPEEFNLKAGVELISDTTKIQLMKETIDEVNPKVFVPTRGDRYFFTKNFIEHVQHLKSLRISKEEYLSYIDKNPSIMPRIKELEAEIYENEQQGKTRNKLKKDEIEKITKNIEKAKELWEIYDKYSEKMIENNLIDFSDMICFVLNAFEESEIFKREVSNKYTYFLVDEYQDTNALQNEIIFNLVDANDEKNIFVVGDDDQIIYGFQGAKSDNIENFIIKYPDTNVICLEENNRSTQSILDFSHKIIKNDALRLENNEKFAKKYNISKHLTAKNPKITIKDKKVKLIEFGDSLQEFNYIAQDIKELKDSEDCPEKLSEIAIICKKRAELNTFAELLKGKNIPCQIDEGKSIFNIRSTLFIYFYMKVLCNHKLSKDKFYSLFLSEPFSIDLEDYNKALGLIDITNNDFLEVFRTQSGWKSPEKIDKFIKIYDELTEYAHANTLRNIVVELINRTGILTAFYKNDKNRTENLAGIKKIIDEAANFEKTGTSKTLAEFVQYLDDCIDNETDICIDKTGEQNAVQLTTYHGSKGREFEYVYLPNLISKNWEKFTKPGEYKYITDFPLEKEEAEVKKDSELLKLLFVGITRAKHSLTLSFADMSDGKSQQITKYLSNYSELDLDIQQKECCETDITKEIYRSVSRDVYDHQRAFQEYIREKAENIELSASRLNDYLACPRKFFYLKILGINVEEANCDSANFGTAIHTVLEKAVKHAKACHSYPTYEDMQAELAEYIKNTRFSKPEIEEKYERLGKEAIEKFYPYFSQIPVSRIPEVEFKFAGIDVDGNIITGKIDRVEKNSDGTYELYDYKTGKSVSEKQVSIGGLRENYFNQLCFYQYAFEKMTNKPVSKTGIIYVEECKTVEKILTQEDLTYIENKIKETFNNIKNLKFNPVSTGEKNADNCKRCQYKYMCRLDLI